MPLIAVWKLRIAARGNLQSIAVEAKETLACGVLSLTLLIGLVANAGDGLVVAGCGNRPVAGPLAASGGTGRDSERGKSRRPTAVLLPKLHVRPEVLRGRLLRGLSHVGNPFAEAGVQRRATTGL